MKKLFFVIIFLVTYSNCISQVSQTNPIIEKDSKGNISSVEFPASTTKSLIPATANEFFTNYLKISNNDEFKSIPTVSKRKEYIHEHYDQYYNGIKVEGCGYNFHFKDGLMYFANGHYIKIDNLSVIPGVVDSVAKYNFAKFENIPIEEIIDYKFELFIKEIESINNNDTIISPLLVYKIYLYTNDENNKHIGIVNAKNGSVIMEEPALIGFSATGTFATIYSVMQTGITQYYTGHYHLADSTRGAIIHTWNLQGSTNPTSAIELSDNDNNWTTAEHSANENNMALDAHWALQHIYDYLNNTYGINSFNGHGKSIIAYIRYGTSRINRDNSYWDPDLHVLYFGDGDVDFTPTTCLDDVSHEFGHGITQYQIGWPYYTGMNAIFQEGMSDIWAVILENRIRPNSIWKIGEQMTIGHSCLRNIQNTNDANALKKIADTYLSTQYSDNNADAYVKSGVLSHWFYLVVNGGTGTNGVGNQYSLAGIGFNKAERLIIESVFNNYLDNTTNWAEVKTAILAAAGTLYCQNSSEMKSITDALYAVNIGTAYNGSQMSISGTDPVCTSRSFTLINQPTGISSRIWSSGNPSGMTVNPTYGNQTTATRQGNFNGAVNLNVTVTGSLNCSTTITRSVWVGAPTYSNPTVDGSTYYPGSSYGVCPGYHYAKLTINGGTADNMSWVLNSSGPVSWMWEPDNSQIVFETLPYYTQYPFSFVGTGTNICTYFSQFTFTFIYGPNCGYFFGPNPADDELVVFRNSPEESGEGPFQVAVELYNSSMEKVYSVITKDNVIRIPVSSFPPGTYFLHIISNEEIIEEQILIER